MKATVTCQLTLIVAFALLGASPQMSTAIGVVFATIMFIAIFGITAYAETKTTASKKELEQRFKDIDLKIQNLTLGKAFGK